MGIVCSNCGQLIPRRYPNGRLGIVNRTFNGKPIKVGRCLHCGKPTVAKTEVPDGLPMDGGRGPESRNSGGEGRVR